MNPELINDIQDNHSEVFGSDSSTKYGEKIDVWSAGCHTFPKFSKPNDFVCTKLGTNSQLHCTCAPRCVRQKDFADKSVEKSQIQ